MKSNTKTIILLSFITIIYASCSKEESKTTTTNNVQTSVTTARDSALKDYNEMYLNTDITNAELAWTGNTANCQEGTISKIAYDRSLQRLNYFRKICGLPYNMVWNNAWHAPSQKIAMMCYANNALSHTPPATWKCYTAEGAAAGQKTNLSLGRHSSASIQGQLEDAGANNFATGHRRWILFSRAQEYGLGSTINTGSLYCIAHISDPLPSNSPAFIAYPPRYIPQSLVFGRWSFGVPNPVSFFSGVDFSNTTVKMTDSTGKNIPLTIVSKNDDGYGDQTIVWEPSVIQTFLSYDFRYHIVVDNVMLNGVKKKYEYDVTIFKP
ncbi:MAG: CAP domain-containing protein [Bacteroidia bacterium]